MGRVWTHYGVAVVSVVLGLLAREALTPIIGPTALPFIFFFPAVAMAAWYGGLRAGVIATVLSLAAADWFFVGPGFSLVTGRIGGSAALAAFLFSCAFIVGSMTALHRANAKMRMEMQERQRAEAELARLREQFASTLGNVGGASTPPEEAASFKLNGSAKPTSRLITFLFLATAALLVCSTIFVYGVGQIEMTAQQRVARQLLVLQQLDGFLSAMKDAETGQRGYLLTGDEAYLQPYTNARLLLDAKLGGLQHLAQSGDLPTDKVKHVAALTSEKLAELEQTIKLRQQQGPGAALTLVRTGRGRRAMDEIRTEIGEMQPVERTELGAAAEKASQASRARTATIIAMSVVSLAFLGWAARKISSEERRREIARLETGRQKEMLATTLASIGDAVIATDPETRVLFLNTEAETLTGWTAAEVKGRRVQDLFHIVNEQTRQSVENPVEKVLGIGSPVGLVKDTVLIARDGREIPIDYRAAPIRHDGEALFGAVIVFSDVSEQRRAEGVLRESRAQEQARRKEWETLFEATPAIVWIAQDRDCKTIKGSRAAAEFLKVVEHKNMSLTAPCEEAPKHFQVYRNGKLLAREELPMQLAARTGQPVIGDEVEHRFQDGTSRFIFGNAVPLFDEQGEPRGAVGAFVDTTERKRAEEALRQNEQLMAADLRAMTTLYKVGNQCADTSLNYETCLQAILDAAITITRADKGNIQLFDAGSGSLKIAAQRGFAEPFLEFFATVRADGASACGEAFACSRRVLVEDVTRSELFAGQPSLDALLEAGVRAVQSTPIVSSAGRILGMISTHFGRPRSPSERELRLMDLLARQTAEFLERKEAEQALHDAHTQLADRAVQLENLVQERTARLQETVDELQHVSYAIAHDMRAPLRAMHAFASLIAQEGQTGASSAETQDYIRRIIDAAGRLDRLIRDALHYTTAAQQDLPLAPVDLSRLMRELVESYPNLHPDNADIFIESELPVVMGNDSLLTQCFSNLLGNAVKFVAPGLKPEVHVRAEKRNGTARIWVQDNGIGIEKNGQARLFAMFQKLDNHYEGTGIGLAIVRKVVLRMGGKVGVESEPGAGSRFWVELPIASVAIGDLIATA